MFYCLVLVLLAPAFAETECDASSMLQARVEAGLQGQPPKFLGGTSCESADLNAGTCVGNNKCYKCDLTQNVWPTYGPGFPDGKLLCAGTEGTTCSLIDDTEKIYFKNFDDYLECRGQSTCSNFWNVQNAGAACCSSASGETEACNGAKISLEPDSDCQNDMCCDGEDVCSSATLNGLNSISCEGEKACVSAVVSLSRDIVCTGRADACVNAEFTVTKGGPHVVKCLGAGSCSVAEFDFAADSRISFECTSNIDPAACAQSKLTLGGDSCLFLQCQDSNVWPGCNSLVVNKGVGDSCYFKGDGTPPAGCDATNSTDPCGDIDPEEICCRGAGGCADCCPTRSTTTTKKPHPYSQYGGWRRNRRENRRENRRQNRRQRSYSYSSSK